MMLLELLNEVVDIDTDIFLSLNRMHSPFFDYFMSTYSGKWIWIPMYAAIWYVMLRNFHWKVTLFCMVGLALVITIADQTGATLYVRMWNVSALPIWKILYPIWYIL